MPSDEFIKECKNNVLNEETIYLWNYTGSTLGDDEFHIRWGGAILASLIPLIIAIVMADSIFSIEFVTVGLIPFIIFVLVCRYLFMPDVHISYFVKKSGVYIETEDVIPDVAYKVVRVIAWWGIGICFFAGVMFGPMIFFGVGGFALLSFGLTNFRPETDKYYVFIEPPTIIFNPDNELFIRIKSYSEKDLSYSSMLYFNSIDEKVYIIDKLSAILGNVEIFNVIKFDDIYEHPVFEKHRKEYEEEELNEH